MANLFTRLYRFQLSDHILTIIAVDLEPFFFIHPLSLAAPAHSFHIFDSNDPMTVINNTRFNNAI